jgi:hypothetical protein
VQEKLLTKVIKVVNPLGGKQFHIVGALVTQMVTDVVFIPAWIQQNPSYRIEPGPWLRSSPVSVWKIFRLSGRVAAFTAMAALLLHISCTIGLTSLASLDVGALTHSGCHEPAPSTPDAPNSEQKCCNGDHSPEALLTVSPAAPAPIVSTGLISSALFSMRVESRHISEIATPSSGPPGPLVLRI